MSKFVFYVTVKISEVTYRKITSSTRWITHTQKSILSDFITQLQSVEKMILIHVNKAFFRLLKNAASLL